MRSAALLMLLAVAVAAAATPTGATGPAPKRTFAITVSTEWAPGSLDSATTDLAAAGCPAEGAASYLADLEAGLRAMAAFFYRYTGGQMAIDKVTIYTGGERWEEASIRVLASRSYRPSAFVGGAAVAPTAYYSATGSLAPAALFYPAPILLGRSWDGRGGRCGAWSAPEGWRTLAHEWAHHALYLFDEYLQQPAAAEQFCDSATPGFRLLRRGERAPAGTGSTVASLMAYHYTADQLSLWTGAAPDACDDTPQAQAHGASAWATVARIYAADGVVAPTALAPGPADAPPVDVTVVVPSAPRARTSARATLGALPRAGLVGQAYLVTPGAAGASPRRIVGQGLLVAGEAQPAVLLGAQADTGDRAAVMVADPVSGAQYSFPADYRAAAPLSVGGANALSAPVAPWRAGLTVTPLLLQGPGETFSQVSALRVRLDECGGKPPEAVEFSYCPAGGACGAPARVETPAGDGSFSHTFFFDQQAPPSAYGYIYAREPLRGAEAITWYQLAGGVGPAHTGGHAPLVDGPANVDLAAPDPRAPTADNRVLYSAAPACAASGALPAGVLGIVGAPLFVNPVIADPNNGAGWGAAQPPLRVRLNYDQDLLDRLGVAEESLLVLRRDAQGLWERVPTAGRSAALDWIAAAPRAFGGQGTVYALGYEQARVLLPLVRR